MNDKWRKVVFEIIKFSAGAILGALGFSCAGCACIPCFNF